MQTCEQNISALKQSPLLPQALAELNAFWKDEQARREKFLADMDESTKSEFIEGNIVLHSPAKHQHNAAIKALVQLAGTYVDVHHLGIVLAEHAMLHLTRNNFEPDVVFWSHKKTKDIKADTMLYPAPDWICEVLSPSTGKIDRGIKFLDYALHGVAEYWVVDPEKQELEQYLLKDDAYELSMKSSSGIVKCKAIPGFTFTIEAIFDKDERLAVLRQFLNHPS